MQKEENQFQNLSIFYKKIVTNKENFVTSLKDEVLFKNIKEKINSDKIQEKIKIISETISKEICADVLNAFWNRKKHQISLLYTDDFNEDKISTKARHIAMV